MAETGFRFKAFINLKISTCFGFRTFDIRAYSINVVPNNHPGIQSQGFEE